MTVAGTRYGHHRSPANGRGFCDHPMGDSHDSRPSPMSPMARVTKAYPTTAPAIPDATRPFSLICVVTSANAPNTAPIARNDAPKLTEPTAGSPRRMRQAAVATAMTTFMAVTRTSAAAVWACRPRTVARSSSVRPLSSSARV